MNDELRYSATSSASVDNSASLHDVVRAGIRRNEALFETVGLTIADAISKKYFALSISQIIAMHASLFHNQGGKLRGDDIVIRGSSLGPPNPRDIPDLLAEMCAYINRRISGDKPLQTVDAVHVAAYALWRLNWIHPFMDGNGAVSRAISYMLLSIGLDSLLPGSPTIPEQIAAARNTYYAGLEDADRAWREGIIDTSDLETMLIRMLETQLLDFANSQ